MAGPQLTPARQPGHWHVSLPRDARDAAGMLSEAAATVAERGGGRLQWWVTDAQPTHDAAAAAAGFEPVRELWQLRRPLPVGEPYDLATRPFEPGRDDDAFVAVNNRAFAWHPDQGGWTVETLRQRATEAWFDPAGFLLHERAGRLAGFCWTKVHAGRDPVLGEIYVIAVDPDFAGQGLGRALVLAGLDHLWSVRGTPIGMLYVEAGNEAAIRLYDRLGFERHQVDKAYAVDIGGT